MIGDAGRKEIVQAAVAEHGAIIHVDTIEQGVKLANEIAPEHVEIMTADPECIAAQVKNAGAICVGPYTPVATGDYFAGPNHVLPTAGTAKFSSPLSVYDFMKFSSVLQLSNERLLRDCDSIARFAKSEGFPNHKDSVECRR
jgi:histidinol dehydrogenase